MVTTPAARTSLPQDIEPIKSGYQPEEIAVINQTSQRLTELLRVSKWRMPGVRRPDAARRLLLDIADRVNQAFSELQRERA